MSLNLDFTCAITLESRRLMNGNDKDTVYISASQKNNIDGLKKMISRNVKEQHIKIYPNYLEPKVY